MKFTNVTQQDLEKALEVVNVKYKGNVEFNNFQPQGKRFNCTLRVKNSRGPGARRSQDWNGKRRRLISACWHVHGDFFDALWDIAPDMNVFTGGMMYRDRGDNWQDMQVGSIMYPAYMSELCDCE